MSKHLSILISKGGFSFCVFKQGKLYHAESFPIDETIIKTDEINGVLDKNLYLNQSYEKVFVSILDERFNLVPSEIFYELNDIAHWISFNTKIEDTDELYFEVLPNLSTHICYAFSPAIVSALINKFTEVTIKNASKVFLKSISKDNEGRKLFVVKHLSEMQIAVLNGNKLEYYNFFTYKNKDEFMYYLLNTIKQLDLDPETIEVYYFGDMKQDELLLKMMMNFIRHVIPGASELDYLKNFIEIEQMS